MEFFAKGHNAQIYSLDLNKQRPCLDQASLIRKEQMPQDEFRFKILYYQSRLLCLIFPGFFPEVVAGQLLKDVSETMVERGGLLSYEPIHVIYSVRLLNIPTTHATYSSHARFDLEGKHIHNCDICQQHDLFHQAHRPTMLNFADKFRKSGIVVMKHEDPTDWCIDQETGLPVFFEIDDLDLPRLMKYIITIKLFPDELYQAEALIRRLRNLRGLS